MNRREETKIVKDALRNAGINAVVSHGRGTAWGWLNINVGSADQFGDHVIESDSSHRYCSACRMIRGFADRALKIAKEVTERDGEYDGRIIVLTQKTWDARKWCSVEIVQSAEKT